jgi:quinol monooxygenase YgiN
LPNDFIKLEYIETGLALYREQISTTRKEPRCIAYNLYIDEKDPGHVIFIEEWPEHAALDGIYYRRLKLLS